MAHDLTPWSAAVCAQEAAIASLRDETVRLQKQIDEKAAAQAALQKDLERVKEAGLGEWLESVGVPFDAIEVTLTGLDRRPYLYVRDRAGRVDIDIDRGP